MLREEAVAATWSGRRAATGLEGGDRTGGQRAGTAEELLPDLLPGNAGAAPPHVLLPDLLPTGGRRWAAAGEGVDEMRGAAGEGVGRRWGDGDRSAVWEEAAGGAGRWGRGGDARPWRGRRKSKGELKEMGEQGFLGVAF